MKKYNSLGIKCISFLLAGAVFFVLVYFSTHYAKGRDDTYRLVCLGDLNLEDTPTSPGVASYLEDKIKEPVFCAFFPSGAMVGVQKGKTNYDSVLSMHNLTISMTTHNYGMQKSVLKNLQNAYPTRNISATMEELSNIDFDKVSVLILEQGALDYLNATPIKNGKDAYDTSTFQGTLRSVIKMLKNKYPDMRIILSTPTYFAPLGSDGSYQYCDETNLGAGCLNDYVEAEIEVATEMGVEYIDAYHLSGIQRETVSEYTTDGLYLNDAGRKEVAELWAEYLLGTIQQTN